MPLPLSTTSAATSSSAIATDCGLLKRLYRETHVLYPYYLFRLDKGCDSGRLHFVKVKSIKSLQDGTDWLPKYVCESAMYRCCYIVHLPPQTLMNSKVLSTGGPAHALVILVIMHPWSNLEEYIATTNRSSSRHLHSFHSRKDFSFSITFRTSYHHNWKFFFKSALLLNFRFPLTHAYEGEIAAHI